MSNPCFAALADAIETHLPPFINERRRPNAELFSVRPYFYDTCAPECYLYCSFIYTGTAENTVSRSGDRDYRALWAYGEECGDHWEIFPDSKCADPNLLQVMRTCYECLCDDEAPDSYKQYADTICRTARKLNAVVPRLFNNVHSCFAIIPADAAAEAIGNADALRMSVPDSILENLNGCGFLNATDENFGI